jgi:hypothetical protein
MGLNFKSKGYTLKEISKASENERHQVIALEAPGMTIAYFGYRNPTPDSTD